MAKADSDAEAPTRQDEQARRFFEHMDGTFHPLLSLFAGFILAIMGVWLATPTQSLDVRIELNAPGGAHLQIFPYINGYSEATSMRLPLKAGHTHQYHFTLRAPRIPKVIRIDPGSSEGRIEIDHIDFQSMRRNARIDGGQIKDSITLRKDLLWERGTQTLISSGGDPWFEVPVPKDVRNAFRARKLTGWSIFTSGLLLCIWALAKHGSEIRKSIQHLLHRRPPLWTFIFSAAAAITILSLFGMGPSSLRHEPLRGLQYGTQLFLAATILSMVGAVVFDTLKLPSRLPEATRLFLWLVIGQSLFVAYFYFRSGLTAAGGPAMSQEETWLVAAGFGYLAWRRRNTLVKSIHGFDLPLQMGVLAAMCLVIADRELPRALMLSSDPDTHAFLAQRILDLGYLPWSGEHVFDYPAGSAFLGAAWSWLSGLDPRDSITALPLLSCIGAALLLAEAVAQHQPKRAARSAAFATALAITAAVFLFPLYRQYAHMEGAGRQISFMFAAAIPALWIGTHQDNIRSGWRMITPLVLMLMTLAALNPISPILPGIVIGAFWLNACLRDKRLNASLLAIPLTLLLLLLDPYYLGLLQGGSSNPKVTIIADYQTLSVAEILPQWSSYYMQHGQDAFKAIVHLMPAHSWPTFAILLLATGLPAIVLCKSRPTMRGWFVAAILIASVLASSGLFFAMRNDPRGYLLAGYFNFSLSQYKFILLVILSSMAVSAGIARGWIWQTSLAGGIGLLVMSIGMQSQQEYMRPPRQGYCGSLGCISSSDLEVLETMQSTMPRATSKGKVLLPNSMHRTRDEFWVFPVAGARALPFHATLEPAFFYYQGSKAFTSESYAKNVCENFNREWLSTHGIRYVFLPEQRSPACIAGIEGLIESEKVLIKSGDSYLLELSFPAPDTH